MTQKKLTKISFADDHVILRESLAKLVQSYDDCTVLDSVSNGWDLLKSIQSGKVPDLVIMDLNMPEMDGYQCSRVLAKKYPKIKILILTMYDSDIPLIRLLQDGIRGFLKKDIHPVEFKYALMNVTQNGYYYSSSSTNQVADFMRRVSQKELSIDKSIMNPLELEFLKYSATQYTYKEIAGLLHVTARHVDNIRNVLFSKLGVKNRVGLAIYAMKNGMVPMNNPSA